MKRFLLFISVLILLLFAACDSREIDVDSEDAAFLSNSLFNYSYVIADGEAYYSGRWYDMGKDKIICTTNCSGSEIYFMADGALSVALYAKGGDICHVVYFVDDGEPVTAQLPIVDISLPDTNRHVVRITIDSVTDGGRWFGTGVDIYKLLPSEGGRIRAIKPMNPVVMYFGDSITEGCAALRNYVGSDDDSATNAYPYFCSKSLNAVSYTVGHGGSGLAVDGIFTTFGNAIEYMYKDEPVDPGIMPAVIVVNHGTNDSISYIDFVAEAKRCLGLLQSRYPGVAIFYMTPFCGKYVSAIQNAVKEFQDCYFVDSTSWRLSYTDGLHPDGDGARVAGEKLAEAILSELTEDFFVV